MDRALTVWVGAEIIYLYGTVNGTAQTFTLAGDGAWQAAVPRSEDDNYLLHLEAYSANGLEGTYDYTLYYGMMPCVTDRTQSDYEEWLKLSKIKWADMTAEQQAIWAAPMKGAYNYTDLNRVGHNLEYLAGVLTAYGYSTIVNVRTDYAIGEWPSPDDMSAYVESVAIIRQALAALSTTPEAPTSMDDGTVTVWNNIEKILADVDALISYMVAAFYYSGELFAGEV